MEEPLVVAADYLLNSEAITLYNALLAEDIPSVVRTVGPSTLPYGTGMYFRLLVRETDLPDARPIVAAFMEKREQELQQPLTCPYCGSPDVWPYTEASWLKKIYYAGTTLYRCRNCNSEFSV